MAAKNDIREFLITRRSRITPEQAGLSAYGRRRRVSGLRREEVALLAGISVEYYIQIERGAVRGVSEAVLDAIARALHLDDTERDHLIDLVRAVKSRPAHRRTAPERVRPGVQRVLDTMTEAAAFVRNDRLDILTANGLGYALYSDAFVDTARPVNLARFVFLNPRSRDFYLDWDRIALDAVGSLRAAAGRDAYDRDLSDLVGELSTRSDEFRARWSSHDVRAYRSGTQPFHHPLVGDLTLSYEALTLPADPGQTIIAYTADPGSPAQQALGALARRAGAPSPSGAP
ncbi:helix-turn-helix domain-containing protein [Aquihabitans sp. McL0605]|uniref:helix-turn-helix domain-containing protein n=1 Tax=Aquihabitans sp. McL0605 TaxID=3415671 RepID=UPI003CEB2A7B